LASVYVFVLFVFKNPSNAGDICRALAPILPAIVKSPEEVMVPPFIPYFIPTCSARFLSISTILAFT
jgi:hypothetical protein